MKAAQDGEIGPSAGAAAPEDAAAMVPRGRRRFTPVTLEEKRARQRAYVKKSYYRQLEQVRLLEAEYARVIGLQTVPTSSKAHPRRSKSPSKESNSEEVNALVDVYAQLTLQKEELRKENEALKAAALTHTKFQRLVQTTMEAEMKPLPPDPEMPILINPYTLEECQQITITTYDEILKFQTGYAYRESTGANVLGWRDERRVLENDQFQFSVRKIFHGRTAAELSLGGWRVNSTTKFRNVYTESIDVKFHVLQQVDADNVIMYRVLHSLDGLYVNKTLFLTTRLRTETGYIILFRSLDPEGRILESIPSATEPEAEIDASRTSQGKQHRWLNLYSWVIFDEVGENGEHCYFDFNGILPNQSGKWMLEMLLVVLRWENIVVGPIFALQVNAMRDEVRLLEHEYTQVAKLRALTLNNARRRRDGDMEKMESYVEILALKGELRKENKQLQMLVKEHTKFQLKAQRFLIKDQQEQLEANDPSTSLDACRELPQASQREIARFLQSNSYLATGASLFGWRDRRKVEGGSLKFSVKKFFYGVTPLELSAHGWQVTSTAQGLRQLHSSNMSTFTWIIFDHAGDDGEHCRFGFGGVVPSTDAAGSHLWMMEVLLIALRWETKTIRLPSAPSE
ncbi:hypothetical protein FI667_g628, partial [Globisporangium splendens]